MTLIRHRIIIPHNLHGEPGLALQVGARIPLASILHAQQAGIAYPLPWVLRCDVHGTTLPVKTWREAKYLVNKSAGWCEKCEGA